MPPVPESYSGKITKADFVAVATETNRKLASTDAVVRYARKWTASTDFVAGEPVVNPSGELVTALATFTSGTTYDRTKWSAPASTTFAPLGSTALAIRPVESVPFLAFGHSYIQGGGGSDNNNRFCNRFQARQKTQALLNYAGAGSEMYQTLGQIKASFAANTRGLVALMSLINDVNNAVPTATIREAFRSCLAYLTAQTVLPYSNSAFAYGSGWTAGATSTAGSYVDFAWVGDTAYLLLEYTTSTTTSVGVVVSGTGVTAATVNTGGWGRAFTGAVKLSGFGAGAHTVRVTLNSGAALTVTGAAIPSPSPATILWLQEGALPGYSTAQNTLITSTLPTALAVVAADFPTVIAVPPTGWDSTTMISFDNTHPNDKGHAFWADRMEAALSGVPFRQGLNWLTTTGAAAAAYTGTTPSFVVSPTAPGQVSGLAVAPSSTQNVLTWSAAAAHPATVTAYKVYRSTSTGTETLFTTLGAVLTYTDTGLTNGTTYYYKVSAVNSIGEGAQSAEASGTPSSSTAPGQVTGLTVTTGASSGTAALAWTAPANNGSAITDYVVQYRQTSVGGAWLTFSDGTSTTAAATVTGLTNDTGYDFQVAAVNAVGMGSYSATATGTPTGAVLASDSFNRANNATSLGTADSGQAWANLRTTVGISNNATIGGGGENVAVLDVGVADMVVTAKQVTSPPGDRMYLVARATDASNYYCLVVDPNNGLRLSVRKRVAGTDTDLYANAGTAQPAGTVWGLKVVGSTITVLRNGVTMTSFTDTAITSGTKAGLGNFFTYAASNWDDFRVTAP